MAILIVGASVRAMAESAARAGEEVIAADLFGDQDLRSIARLVHVLPTDNYPNSIPSISARYPGIPRCYTGGLENRPAILESLAAGGPLWGNGAEVVRPVRDPFQFRQFLMDHGFNAPAIRQFNDPPVAYQGWLIKPNQGTGGNRIRLASMNSATENEYFQKIENGISCSALFVGIGNESQLIGISRQILASETTSPLSIPSPYAYVGSIGPLASDTNSSLKKGTGSEPMTFSSREIPRRDVPVSLFQQLGKLGQELVRVFKLQGLFGVDFLWDQERVVIIEINPRYPASAEVFELAHQTSLFAIHRAACTGATSSLTTLTSVKVAIGKWILFAPENGRLTRSLPTLSNKWGELWCSDFPEVGQSFQKGEPVTTLLIAADTATSLPIWPAEHANQLWKNYFTTT